MRACVCACMSTRVCVYFVFVCARAYMRVCAYACVYMFILILWFEVGNSSMHYQ